MIYFQNLTTGEVKMAKTPNEAFAIASVYQKKNHDFETYFVK